MTRSIWTIWATWAAVAVATVAGAVLFAYTLLRILLRRTFVPFVRRLMTDPYDESLLEPVNTAQKLGLQTQFESELRAESGQVIKRPFGSPRKHPHFEGLMLDFAHLDRFPLSEDQAVELRTVIGPQAAKPLVLDMPLLIAPMAFGLSLSERAKVALAKGASLVGTATNTGEGPFLNSERAAAKHLILQYNRGTWAKDPQILRQADAIEIQFGVGARGALGHVIPASQLDSDLRRRLGLAEGEDAVTSATQPGIASAADLACLVDYLRQVTGGVPIGTAFAAGKYLERDLAFAVQAGVDYLSVCGAEGGTWGIAPAIEDDFGLPTLYALSRAVHFLEQEGLRKRVSLIIAGKMSNPGEFLKALAMGADAVYLGTIALLAMTHTQSLKALPWEPPTELVWYTGKQKARFDVAEGTQSLARFLKSCGLEMEMGLRALGRASLRDLSRTDLMALDPLTADVCGVELAYSRPAAPGSPVPLPPPASTPVPARAGENPEGEGEAPRPPGRGSWLSPTRRPRRLS